MYILIALISLYLTNLEVEGDFIVDTTRKTQFVKDFTHREVSLESVIDSLFYIYEEVGFFNVRFKVTVDTLCGDTVTVKIEPVPMRLPVIKIVKTEGIGFPPITLYTYFPFKGKVFQRSSLVSSFSVLHNLGLISSAEYFFVPLSEKNVYALKIYFKPMYEAFSLNLTGGEKGFLGSVSLAHPSILGSGIGLWISGCFDNEAMTSYGLRGMILLPGVRGLLLKGDMVNVSDTNHVVQKDVAVSWWGKNQGVTLGVEKTISSLYSTIEIWYTGGNWKSGFEIRKGNGWIFSNILVFEHRITIETEQGYLFSGEPHYLIMSKPVRTFRKFLYPNNLHSYFLVRVLIPFKSDVSFFIDGGYIVEEHLLDAGLAYIKDGYGIYLGYSWDKNVKKVNVGFVLGVKNSLFERSIRIL